MKKALTSLILFLGFLQISAQEESVTGSDGRMNDIMLSPIELIAAPALNLSYERLLSESSGLGINALMYLGSDDDGFSQFSPYYRLYFGKKYASGFFVEGFLPITTIKESYNNDYIPYPQDPKPVENTETSFGVGIGFGGKWVAKKNIVFEASAGIGRRFITDSDYIGDALTGKGMLGIGYRF